MPFAPLAAALALTLLLTLARLGGTVDSDVAWQLWIGGRIHAGANLYTDIIETNPPLWFWVAVPVDRLADLLHIRVEAALVGVLGVVVALALVATNRLTGYIAARQRGLLLCYAGLALLGAPWMHAGQREQLVLIATLPYAALIAARRRGHRVSVWLAAFIGIGAALGFALKHYFLLVPLALELWLFATAAQRRLLRPETLALAAMAIAYAGALITFDPDFVTRIV
ncbi:MAG TPA: GtrA family protein, partial [Sphingomicrobium sp.]